MEDRCILLADSWKTFTDQDAVIELKPEELQYETITIPPKVTERLLAIVAQTARAVSPDISIVCVVARGTLPEMSDTCLNGPLKYPAVKLLQFSLLKSTLAGVTQSQMQRISGIKAPSATIWWQ
ncbi:hypothetical protein RvY_18672 [Ramazzottius varieornatus]|uniref:Uncharacterized protein n=1 Tax=Ramazzottius varieornatus TaxID=947166 RepID=A0A1D1WAU4_RAMVA|nr:hypothetical protein RvY_18672 [Ramazzottius varieornatus]